MSEGELKKRIFTEIDMHALEIDSELEPNITKILDEAKKDMEDGSFICMHKCHISIPIDEWKKWFGE